MPGPLSVFVIGSPQKPQQRGDLPRACRHPFSECTGQVLRCPRSTSDPMTEQGNLQSSGFAIPQGFVDPLFDLQQTLFEMLLLQPGLRALGLARVGLGGIMI